MKVRFPEDRINGFSVYEAVDNDGNLIVAFHGPLAAISIEQYFRIALREQTTKPVRAGDIFKRFDNQRLAEVSLSHEEKVVFSKISDHSKSQDKYNFNNIYLLDTGITASDVDTLTALRDKELIVFDDRDVSSDLGVEYGRLSVLGKKYLGIISSEEV